MKVWLPFIICAFTATGFGQSSERIEVPLTFKEFRTVKEMIALSFNGIPTRILHIPRGYNPLPGTVKPIFFELSHEAGKFIGITALSSPQAEGYDRIWIDWNKDKKFTGDEKLMGKVSVEGKKKLAIFGPIERSLGDAKIEGYLIFHDDNHIRLVPRGYYEGEAELNGRKVKVGLVDRNLNGVLDDRTTAVMMIFPDPWDWEWGGDILLVDFDGDGTFLLPMDEPSGISLYWGEVYYLTNLAQLPDGNFYRIRAAEDRKCL